MTNKMNKYDFWGEIFASNKQLIVSFVVVFGSLITRESYFLLKRPGVSKFRQFLSRAVITFFLCMLLNSYIRDWSPKYHVVILGGFALVCIPTLDWFLNSLWPAALGGIKTFAIKWLVNAADKYKDDKEGKEHE